jgi:hypothetical protein
MKLLITIFYCQEKEMSEISGPIGSDWLKLVAAANFLGVYPGTLYRRWRYGRLPEGVCIKQDNTLYFNRDALESIRDPQRTQSAVGIRRESDA